MGRTAPSRGLQPQATRKEQRAKQARTTINKTIPKLLSSSSRARKGIDAAELITDPASAQDIQPGAPTKPSRGDQEQPDQEEETISTAESGKLSFSLRLIATDTLTAACLLHSGNHKKNVAILNMASPLRPGGGVLNGATSQEETLCLRTTLYPSLREEFYRLPEVGGIWTHDVMVFKDVRGEDLGKSGRWWVDVVSAGMLRFPDIDDVDGAEDGRERYANPADRRLVEAKMTGVLRILKAKGVERVVLGAWGCGAYGNPVEEIAQAWRRILYGHIKDPVKKSGSHKDGAGALETWDNLKEVGFAIKDKRMAEEFATHFGEDLEIETVEVEDSTAHDDAGGNENDDELAAKITELEDQIQRVRSAALKASLKSIVEGLEAQLADRGVLRQSASTEDTEKSSATAPSSKPTTTPGPVKRQKGKAVGKVLTAAREDIGFEGQDHDLFSEDPGFFDDDFFDSGTFLKPGEQKRPPGLDRRP